MILSSEMATAASCTGMPRPGMRRSAVIRVMAVSASGSFCPCCEAVVWVCWVFDGIVSVGFGFDIDCCIS